MDLGSVTGSVALQSTEYARSTLAYLFTSTPLKNFAKSTVLSTFGKIRKGCLVIQHPNGEKLVLGEDKETSASLIVHNDYFWIRVFLSADIGFAESFMLGEISCPDLMAIFKLLVLNHKRFSNFSTPVSSVFSVIWDVLYKATDYTTISRSRLNIAAHYDLSNEMFAAFMSHDMTYSSAIFLLPNDPGYELDTLEAAQIRKIDRMIENVKLQPTDHLLEIGCGWGSFSIRAVTKTGCRVTALTLSTQQKQLFEERIAAAGLGDKITVLLCDYRSLPIPETPYDKIVSIEALECCAAEELIVYYRCVDQLLKKDGGICSVQVTTTPETRYANQFPKGEGFIPKYIFPGAHAPSVSTVISAIQKGGQNNFDIDSVINYGPHYAKTLRMWRENFEANFESKIVPALLREYKSLSKSDLEVFRKKYIYYFSYTETGFATKILHISHITISRQMTRESIGVGESALI